MKGIIVGSVVAGTFTVSIAAAFVATAIGLESIASVIVACGLVAAIFAGILALGASLAD